MASIYPFNALRYTSQAGPIESLATLPYDVIPLELEAEYKARSPYNFAHLILPRGDYSGAARRLNEWTAVGVIARDSEEAVYVYEQGFPAPGTGEWLTRRGLIATSDTEDYGKTVFRHERTLAGPKEDRLRLLAATLVQFDSIFMLFSDEGGEVEATLETVAAGPAEVEYSDHQKTTHRLWRVTDGEWIARTQALMAAKKLLIADGHHRYETALRLGQARTLMTLVAMQSPGLRCFATHRLVHSLDNFSPERFVKAMTALGRCEKIEDRRIDLRSPARHTRIVAATAEGLWAIDVATEEGALNVSVLEERILGPVLGLTPERVTAGANMRYKRSIDEALAEVREGRAQIAFLLEDLPVEGVARVSFEGQVLPQKSTYFYPKLGSGLVMYGLD